MLLTSQRNLKLLNRWFVSSFFRRSWLYAIVGYALQHPDISLVPTSFLNQGVAIYVPRFFAFIGMYDESTQQPFSLHSDLLQNSCR